MIAFNFSFLIACNFRVFAPGFGRRAAAVAQRFGIVAPLLLGLPEPWMLVNVLPEELLTVRQMAEVPR